MPMFGDDGEKEFLRDLVLRQQRQIEGLEERIHALADPIAAARISHVKAMAERAARPATDAEVRLGLKTRIPWRAREDRPADNEPLTDPPDDGMPSPTRDGNPDSEVN